MTSVAFPRLRSSALALSTVLAAVLPASAQQMQVETMPLMQVSDMPPEVYVGTVRASDMYGLSYEARGCIVSVSETAKTSQVATEGQMLVELDDQRALLSFRTSEARLEDLKAAVTERELTVSAAEADERRRAEELEFVAKEFERNQTMFRRGLINESTMETVERRMMDATFSAERATEAMQSALSAKARAEIAVEIGELDLRTAEITRDQLNLSAPFDGVLVGFDANVGACVQEGELAAQIYAPHEKAVDVYVLISRLSAADAAGVSSGSAVRIDRINGESCGGTITAIETEADLESQYVKTTIDVDEACAPDLFLNEAVEVEVLQGSAETFRIPASALLERTVYLLDEASGGLTPATADVVMRDGGEAVVRLPGALGRQIVVDAMAEGVEALLDIKDPS